MNRLISLIRAAVLALAAMASPALAGGFTPELFERWIDARVGTGEPVYWYSVGTVRAYPSGELLFTMEGYDAARMHRPDPARPLAHQYNRKIYVFRDPESGEILREYEGQPVEPIAYPYQFITYELIGDEVETFVEQGAGAAVRRIGPGRDIHARMLGDTAVYTAPVYLDFPIPGTEMRYQAFENYDFFVQPEGSVGEPHQLSWVRYGPAPQWAGGQDVIMHMITWRIDDFTGIPADLRNYIETDAPLWQMPPESLDEIRALQAAD